MQVSLKALFGILSFGAVVAWCVSVVGVDNGMFWFVAVLSVLMAGLFAYVAGGETCRACAPFVPVLFVPFLLFTLSLTLFTLSALLFFVGIFFALNPRVEKATRRATAVVCLAIALIVGSLPGMAERRKLIAMQQEFPIESLAQRLDYETPPDETAPVAPVVLQPEVSTRLARFEQELDDRSFRTHQLEQIHNGRYEAFIRASGFGISRMAYPRPERLRLPALRAIPFAADTATDNATHQEWWSWRRVGKSDDVEHLHKVSQYDFLDAEAFGATFEPVEKVAGFVEHAFHVPPTQGMHDPDVWTINRLELVSLLKFDEPRVYELDHLPRMDELSSDEAPTRPLNEFEAQALAKLYTDDDLVIAHSGREYKMLGSLRASKQCLDCHSVPRGTLLGAFSYDLERAEAEPKVKGASATLHQTAAL